MDVFVLDWDVQDAPNAASRLEAMGHHVAGVGTSVREAVQGIAATHPDAVVVWANRGIGETMDVLRRAIHVGQANALPAVFVDAAAPVQARLHHFAAPAVFTDSGHLTEGLGACERAIARAREAAAHASARHPRAAGADHAS